LSANAKWVIDEQECIRTLLVGWELSNVFNMDETALFYAMSPNKGLATTKRHSLKQSKLRLTLAFTVNAMGTEHLPPLIIGHYKRPRCFQKKTGEQLGFDYWWNSWCGIGLSWTPRSAAQRPKLRTSVEHLPATPNFGRVAPIGHPSSKLG